VSDYDIRVLEPDEYRTASDVFGAALHMSPASDEHWPAVVGAYEPGRTLGAFRDGELVGNTQSFASKVALPGGALLPMAMVSRVGVRADHTRRGVLTSLKRAQLSGLAEPFASLRASEGVIYGRFGYGVATRGRTVVLDRARAITHPTVPTDGRVRIVASDEALPAIYDRIGAGRAGWLARPQSWWVSQHLFAGGRDPVIYAIHRGPDGDDGFARYTVERARGHLPHQRTILHVHDLQAATPGAWADLWRFLLTVDLVHDVQAHLRPLDEPLEQLFTDHRAVHTTNVEDETWLRIVNVPLALAARSFGELSGNAGSTVIEVHDPLLPANSGRYRLGDGPARPVSEPAELAMDVATLSTVFLGDIAPSALAMTGRLTTIKTDALAVADRLFAVPASPWCGTYF
jgi:predicted acetyltransferase